MADSGAEAAPPGKAASKTNANSAASAGSARAGAKAQAPIATSPILDEAQAKGTAPRKGRTPGGAAVKAAVSKGASKGASKGTVKAALAVAGTPSRRKASASRSPGKGIADPVPAPRRRAVANAAAATHGRSVTPWTAEEITDAFSRLEAINPEPVGELESVNTFTLLVAVVLSAQATDAGVNKATRGLFAAASTPEAMAALGEEGIAHYIRTIGLYKGKAKNVAALSRILVERYHGEVPCDREALESLPGVGRKTANVVLNIAFHQPTIAVDTHIFRVANRTGLAPGKTPLAVEEALEERIPEHFKLHAHHWLILHGRYICKARLPDCFRCPIVDLCRWPEKNL